MVQIPRPGIATGLHRDGNLLGLAWGLRRDRHGRRVGPQARVRGRLHRQGHRQRRARPGRQHRDPADGHAPTPTPPARSSSFTAALTTPSSPRSTRHSRIGSPQARALQQNPERDWGRDTLDAVRFAFYLLNEKAASRPEGGGATGLGPREHDRHRVPVSNGGGAALAAAEQDTASSIDGVAVAEPMLQLGPAPGHHDPARRRVQPAAGRCTITSRWRTCTSRAPPVDARRLVRHRRRATRSPSVTDRPLRGAARPRACSPGRRSPSRPTRRST